MKQTHNDSCQAVTHPLMLERQLHVTDRQECSDNADACRKRREKITE